MHATNGVPLTPHSTEHPLGRRSVRFRKSVTASVCFFWAGLLAAGCSSGSSSSPAAPATQAAATSGPATTPAPAPSGTQAAGSPAACTVNVLSFVLGTKAGASSQQTTQVVD